LSLTVGGFGMVLPFHLHSANLSVPEYPDEQICDGCLKPEYEASINN